MTYVNKPVYSPLKTPMNSCSHWNVTIRRKNSKKSIKKGDENVVGNDPNGDSEYVPLSGSLNEEEVLNVKGDIEALRVVNPLRKGT